MNLLETFKTYVTVQNKGKDYISIIKHYLEFCQINGIDPLTVTHTELEKFLAVIKSRGIGNCRINGYLKALRSFYRCLLAHNLYHTEIEILFKHLKSLKEERKKRVPLSQEEIDDIIEMGMTFCEQIQPYKIKVILYFLFFTGVRKKELLRLKREDIDLKNNLAYIKLPTKGKEEGIVLFPAKLSEMLEEYFKIEPQEINNAFNITEGQFLYLIKQLKDFSPNGKKFYIHILRHSFGNLLAKNKVDIRTAQKLLRHKNIETTAIYYDPDLETIKETYFSKIKIKKRA